MNVSKVSTAVFLSAILIGLTIPSASASHLCGTTILVDTALTHDELCTNVSGGITIGAPNVELDLDGFKISCTPLAAGYLGSCQGLGTVGVDTGGNTGASVADGKIENFAFGVMIVGGSADLEDLVITGPPSPGLGINPRPAAQGVRISGVTCPNVVEIEDSLIENHREGIAAFSSGCIDIEENTIQNNNSDPVPCFGILFSGVVNSNIEENLIQGNGEGFTGMFGDAGIQLDSASTGNSIEENRVINNLGDGIKQFEPAGGNQIEENELTGNTGTDLIEFSSDGTADNTYEENTAGTTAF